ncbi:hypothetical protein Y032_0360g3438 [Ancylostoma ceylanicum]|uniref:Uncharacterized protein n=1 Tax=Ancylostoma ceylanicum TaxID=53326 RepID=A0A016RWC5_9BILA|nr:hypothetical protein Y032_0360g3438 [Ancylostoma ceylanicum]
MKVAGKSSSKFKKAYKSTRISRSTVMRTIKEDQALKPFKLEKVRNYRRLRKETASRDPSCYSSGPPVIT